MHDLQKYWREVHALADGLPAFVWLVSLEDARRGMRGGSISETTADTAAKLLHANSHRRASEEEIAAHLASQEEAQRLAFHERLKSKGIAVVPLAK